MSEKPGSKKTRSKSKSVAAVTDPSEATPALAAVTAAIPQPASDTVKTKKSNEAKGEGEEGSKLDEPLPKRVKKASLKDSDPAPTSISKSEPVHSAEDTELAVPDFEGDAENPEAEKARAAVFDRLDENRGTKTDVQTLAVYLSARHMRSASATVARAVQAVGVATASLSVLCSTTRTRKLQGQDNRAPQVLFWRYSFATTANRVLTNVTAGGTISHYSGNVGGAELDIKALADSLGQRYQGEVLSAAGVAQRANRTENTAFAGEVISSFGGTAGFEVNLSYTWLRIWRSVFLYFLAETFGGAWAARPAPPAGIIMASQYLSSVRAIAGGVTSGSVIALEVTSAQFQRLAWAICILLGQGVADITVTLGAVGGVQRQPHITAVTMTTTQVYYFVIIDAFGGAVPAMPAVNIPGGLMAAGLNPFAVGTFPIILEAVNLLGVLLPDARGVEMGWIEACARMFAAPLRGMTTDIGLNAQSSAFDCFVRGGTHHLPNMGGQISLFRSRSDTLPEVMDSKTTVARLAGLVSDPSFVSMIETAQIAMLVTQLGCHAMSVPAGALFDDVTTAVFIAPAPGFQVGSLTELHMAKVAYDDVSHAPLGSVGRAMVSRLMNVCLPKTMVIMVKGVCGNGHAFPFPDSNPLEMVTLVHPAHLFDGMFAHVDCEFASLVRNSGRAIAQGIRFMGDGITISSVCGAESVWEGDAFIANATNTGASLAAEVMRIGVATFANMEVGIQKRSFGTSRGSSNAQDMIFSGVEFGALTWAVRFDFTTAAPLAVPAAANVHWAQRLSVLPNTDLLRKGDLHLRWPMSLELSALASDLGTGHIHLGYVETSGVRAGFAMASATGGRNRRAQLVEDE